MKNKKRSKGKKSAEMAFHESLIKAIFSLFQPSKKRKSSPGLIKFFRWGLSFVLLLLFFVWSGVQSSPPPIPSGDELPSLYSNQCDDNLRALHIEAINKAQKSILLYMYSLSDGRIIKALNEKAQAGVEVTVVHDTSTPQYGYHKLSPSIQEVPLQSRGLMHKKILVTDKENVFLGSANFTTESLRSHDNLVVAVHSPALAQIISENEEKHPKDFIIGGQHVEYWSLPEDNQEGFQRLLHLIDSAKKTLRVAMFTLTHPDLTNALIRAHQRHVNVEVVIDAQQAAGVCAKRVEELIESQIPVRINRGSELFHHKFAYIDRKILVNGSANWTKAAFSKNNDCFLILHDLQPKQISKLDKLWHAIRAISQPVQEEKVQAAA